MLFRSQPDTDTPAFLLREIELGPSLGDSYVVLSGLNEGDEVVTNGAFTIDASAQLAGKRSMMNEISGDHVMLTVQGLCEMCKDRIEKAAKSVEGVLRAVWVQADKKLHLDFDPDKTSADTVAKTIAAAGHDTDKYKADQATYDSLPACCKYRD